MSDLAFFREIRLTKQQQQLGNRKIVMNLTQV